MNLTEIKNILEENGIHLKKRWGQNFLFDENILGDIADSAEISGEDLVIEVGPGIGTLTEVLLKKAGKVIAVEIDRRFSEILKERFGSDDRFDLINKNILDVDLKEIIGDSHQLKSVAVPNFRNFRVKVVSNLPYYITSPIIMYFLESGCRIKTMVFTMQAEVAQRVVAKPGSKDFGILTAIVDYYSRPVIGKKIKKGSFYPAPNVDSAVVKFDVLEKPAVDVDDRELLFKIIKTAFSQRRKTIKNNLLRLPEIDHDNEKLQAVLKTAGIEPGRRAETISIEEYASICNTLIL